MMKNPIKESDALLIVDAQLDFFPGGALPVPKGDEIIPIINKWITTAQKQGATIFASRDWHPSNHCSFIAEGGIWPVHCVATSEGANIHPKVNLPKETIFINKGEHPQKEGYSAFEGKSPEGIPFTQLLQQKRINRLFISGLALDYCVYETALDARKHGYDVHLLLEGTRPITQETGQAALEKLKEAGVIIEE